MISLSDYFATVVPIGNSLSASSRERGCARFREGVSVFATGVGYTDSKVREKHRAVVC